MLTNNADKGGMRRTLLATRQALAPAARTAADAQIAARVSAWVRQQGVDTLGVYWPMRGEPDLRPLYEELAQRGVRLALPETPDQAAALRFAEWQPGETTRTDRFGAAVPARQHVPVAPQALLVPCVGFNRQRFRLGYGAGFYDRTLAQAPRPRTLGVAYALGLAEFEAAAHDIALDAIVTETLVLPE